MFDVKPIVSSHNTDCGPTCLKMLLGYYGIDVALGVLNQECALDISGCTAADLKKVGNMHGLDIKAYEMTCDELLKQDRPAIIHWKHNHFVIFCGLNKNGDAVICNPDSGRFGVPVNAFESFFSGVCLFNGEPEDMFTMPSTEERMEVLEDAFAEFVMEVLSND